MTSRIKYLLIILLLALFGLGVTYFGLLSNHRPNVILIGLDTTRADHLGVYGYERGTSPNLDAFAKENIIYKNAVSAAPWTPPSFATIFTGLYPSAHHMMPPDGRGLAKKSSVRLDDRLTTLTEIFKQNGYSTAGITPNPWLKPEFGYKQGFDQYYFRARARADEITRGAIKILDSVKNQNSPFFLFVHYMDPHDPYRPPKPYNEMFKGALKARRYDPDMMSRINQYDGEIRFMDEHVGKLINAIKQGGLYKDSIILIFGDHGEQFLEHGNLTHGYNLYSEETHVPLLIRSGASPKSVDFTVSLVDVFPTLLDLSDIKIPEQVNGLSLKNEENLRQRNGVVSEILRKYNQKSITSFEGQKLIKDWPLDDGLIRSDIKNSGTMIGVFDRNIDPFETKPLGDKALEGVLLDDLSTVYQSAVSMGLKGEAKSVEFDDQTLQQLKSLGYLK